MGKDFLYVSSIWKLDIRDGYKGLGENFLLLVVYAK